MVFENIFACESKQVVGSHPFSTEKKFVLLLNTVLLFFCVMSSLKLFLWDLI